MERYHPTTRQDFGAKNRRLIFGGSLAKPKAKGVSHNNHAMDSVCDGPMAISPRGRGKKAIQFLPKQAHIRIKSAGFREPSHNANFGVFLPLFSVFLSENPSEKLHTIRGYIRDRLFGS